MSTATAAKPKRDPFAPPVVGEPYTYTVTYSGTVESRNDDGSLVIGDYTVPRRTGNGVSMCMIGEPSDDCDCSNSNEESALLDSAETRASNADGDLVDVIHLVVDHHQENHVGAFTFCTDTLCRRVGEKVRAAH